MADENGAAYAVFSVRLSGASDNLINVAWHTEDGTGHAGTDYKATSGTVTFQPGETEKQIQVEVYGRTPGQSTEDRTFLIRLLPPIGAVLEAATAECTISVVTEDDAIFTVVYLPAGPRGRPGDGGLPGLSTFELAKLNGFVGTLAQWLATVTGRNIELQKGTTHIQWRPVETEHPQPWQDLVALADITGDPGDDGKEVELQKTSTAIQWRLEGGAWADLVLLSDLKADPQPLKNRSNWVSGTTYNPGDYVAATATTSSAKSLYFLIDAVSYVSTIAPKDDLTHWLELSPPAGPPGKRIELQKGTTAIQYRYEGDTNWIDLVALSDLEGNPGVNGREIQLQKGTSYIQWRYDGDSAWTNLVALADLTGANGKNIELQKGATYIQWRVVGDASWTNLIAIADITGSPGANGATWLSGAGVPSSSVGNDGDFFLRTDNAQIYKKSSGAWAVIMTIGSNAIQWFSSASVPSNTTGKDGDLHLHETTGEIRKRTTVSGTTSWNVIVTIPKFATSAEAKAAASSTVAATPAGVREFMEQYGFTASYMTDSTDLNTITSTTDRTVCFGFNASTANIPVAGSYGRGIMIAGGGNNSTQVAWINGSIDQYVRFHNGSTWTAWVKQAFNINDITTTAWSTPSLLNGWTAITGRRIVFRKVLGLVFISCNANGAGAGQTIFNLPAGYKPPTDIVVPIYGSMGSTLPGYVPIVVVDSNGNVTPYNFTPVGAQVAFELCFATQ